MSLPMLFFNGEHFESPDVQILFHDGEVGERCRLQVWQGMSGNNSVVWIHTENMIQIGPADPALINKNIKGWRYQGSSEDFSLISEIGIFVSLPEVEMT